MILKDLTTHLKTKLELTSLIDDRIYQTRAPQNTLAPYVLIGRISGTPGYDLSGESGSNTAVIDVTCVAQDPNGAIVANDVAWAIRNAVSGFHLGRWGETWINACTLESEPSDDYEEEDESDNGYHKVSFSLRVTHTTTIPSN